MNSSNVTDSTTPGTRYLEPGTYIDSHWGHYQSARTVELARELGWQPRPCDDRTQEQEVEHVDGLAVAYLEHGTLGDDDYDEWYEIVQEAEDYINEHHVDDDHWFGHHPDIGDMGVWEVDEDE